MADVYEIVTQRIIRLLEEGTIPWHKPWSGNPNGAYNLVSRKPYSFLNQMLLGKPGAYLTLGQCRKLGGKVRKGEKASLVTFFKMQDKSDVADNLNPVDESKDEDVRRIPILRYYYVFHISQTEGISEPSPLSNTLDIETDELAENIFYSYLNSENITYDESISNEAFYSPSRDLIHLPYRCQFDNVAEYYSCKFHECVHSTGADGRLNRNLGHVAFGSNNYSKEELIAEIGSSFILHMLGIESESSLSNSASYIDGWLSALRNDRRLIVSASSKAQQAVEYIYSFSQL